MYIGNQIFNDKQKGRLGNDCFQLQYSESSTLSTGESTLYLKLWMCLVYVGSSWVTLGFIVMYYSQGDRKDQKGVVPVLLYLFIPCFVFGEVWYFSEEKQRASGCGRKKNIEREEGKWCLNRLNRFYERRI